MGRSRLGLFAKARTMDIVRLADCRDMPTDAILAESQRHLMTDIDVSLGQHDADILGICFEGDPRVFAVSDRQTRWPELLKACGVFPSTSEARRSGHHKDIPDGYSEVVLRRKLGYRPHKWRICVLKEPEGLVPAGAMAPRTRFSTE